jgi:hypothetical protein
MAATWLCPSCGRRVPASFGECRCGSPRPSAVAVARVAARGEKLPRDIRVLLVVLALIVVGGLAALFFPYGPTRGTRLLGTVDRPRSPVPATPTPPPPPARR